MRVVVVGGGAIGTSAAYALASRGAEVVVVERTGVACAASGKAGGFLARDWCDGTELQSLARRSFDLHAQWAAALDGDWGWRRMTTYSGVVGRRPAPDADGWRAAVEVHGRLGTEATTAQVDPRRFTLGMMRAAASFGAELRAGEATGLIRRGDAVAGVLVEGRALAADAVVLAMGPWSTMASRWVRMAPVFGLKGHSVVLAPERRVPAEALFLEYGEEPESMLTPEVFPRADGTVYVCAISSQAALPPDPADVSPDRGAVERLVALCGRISPWLAGAPVVAAQACFRPVTRDGLPLIGAVPEARGAYVATGHGVWGILNAPATGEAVAELVLEGKAATVDLGAFGVGRGRAFR